mmetsp:Transcript_27884/g.49866  ORF Transcript_27884/g.49866 Transcript_27884/m.49866 type:complete len:400 (-) Transcript_27884:54-1253(-)
MDSWKLLVFATLQLWSFSGAAAPPVEFGAYLKAFGKAYPDEVEYNRRKDLFEQRLQQVKAVNALAERTWLAAVNHFSDATEEERRQMLGYNKHLASGDQSSQLPSLRSSSTTSLPEAVDWRNRLPTVVTPVKKQGGCGSCWAFAAAQVIESHVALETGVLMSLSPQQLNSCTPNTYQCGGTGGCSGATAQLAFNYTISVGGIADIWTYPYLSGSKYATVDCKKSLPEKVASITGFVSLPQNDIEALAEAVATKGPIAVTVSADDWWSYDRGIFDGCNKTAPNLNHAVVLDGYGVENGTKYWLVRNSWGTSWGENGYIRLRRYETEPCGEDPVPLDGYACKLKANKKVIACGECGVLSDSSYPTGARLGGAAPAGQELQELQEEAATGGQPRPHQEQLRR